MRARAAGPGSAVGRPGWRAALPGLGVALAALALLWWQVRPTPVAPSPLPCHRAVVVDGQLRCDAELPDRVAALCPGGVPSSASPDAAALEGGDVIDTAIACARLPVAPGGRTRMDAEDLAALGQPVEINEASVDELRSLPRIGPTLARRIVEGRPYADVDALLRVRGIGPVTLQRLRARVRVRRPAPVAP